MSRYRFGEFVVDTDRIELTGADGHREVEPQVFDVLRYLVESGGRLVTKEELLDNIWGDRFVSESALTTRIKQARRAVDDDGRRQWAIKTVHGRGFRFLPDVTVADVATEAAAPVESPTASEPGGLPEELGAVPHRPLRGRDDELLQCLDVVQRPAPSFGWVWILGEPGIGKTTLAAEVARRAHALGHTVLFGRNSEDLRVPHQPFIEVIRQAAGAGVVVDDDFPPGLRLLLPGGDVADVSPASANPSEDEALRFAMFEGVADWLALAAADRPLTVIVDDVHWAADSTLQLLSHLQGRPDGADSTFVLTARDTAPDVHPKVAGLIAAAQGRDATAVVRLAGLAPDAAAELLGAEPGLDMAEVMRLTAGNPLFLQAVNPIDGSVDIDSAVHRRLLTLDPQVQDTLRVVSVVGYEFELSVAAATLDRDDLDVLDDLEAAVAARILDDVGLDRFRFSHALVRSSLRSTVGSGRRARLHGRIAQAYEARFGGAPDRLPELAFHTAEAAMVDRALRPVAVDRLTRAAEEASARFSFEEAGELLRRARTIVADADTHLEATLALRQGVAESRAGRNMTAARSFAEAIALAAATDDVVLRVEAALRYEDASWRPGLPGDEALRQLDEATEALDAALATGAVVTDELTLRARMAVARFRALAMSGRRDGVHEAFVEARRLAGEIESPDVEANVLSVYVGHVLFYEDLDASAVMVDRLAELHPLIRDNDVALHALHDRIMFATLTGRFDDRRELVQSMADLQARWHSRFWRFIRANQEAMEAFYQGDLDAAERLAVHCRDLADALPEEDGSGTFGLRMFLIRREQDRLAAMAPLIRRVVAQADGSPLWTPGLAMLLAETGATEEAAAVLEPIRAAGFRVPSDAMWSTVMVLLAEAAVALGDVDSCRILRTRMQSLAGINVTTGAGMLCFGRGDRYLGMLSFVLGELDRAEHHLGIALEGDSDGGSVLWSNESRLWLARVRRAQGHEAEASLMAEVVAKEAADTGLARLARIAAEEIG